MTAGSGSAPPLAAGRYQVEDLVIDTRVRLVTRDGADLAITSLSFDLLWALVRVAPHLVSFDDLMEQVWTGLVISPETITQRVKLLRQALGDSADSPRYILAVRGHGYRMPMAAAAAPEPELAAAAAPLAAPEADLAAVPPGAAAGAAHRWWPLLAAVLILLAGGAWWALDRRSDQRQPPLMTAAAVLPSESVAVMPFANMTGDPAKEYFGDGMAEEMINALGQVPGLKVPARSSSFAYKGRNLDIRRIGQDLGVSTVLEGSVRSAGSRIRITAQLIDAQSGYQLWSQSYDRDSGDIFKLQDDLAAAIIKALRVNLNGSVPALTAQAPPTQNVEAYDLYLQGDAMMFVADHGLERALERYQRAIALDPKFARAYVGAGLAKFLLGISQGPPVENLAAARRFADQALQLDPSLSTAHSLLANVAFTQGRWLDAEPELREALRLGPRGATEHFSHGINWLFTGHLREALGELETAVQLNPTHLQSIGFRSIAYSLLGRDAEALRSAHLGAHLGDMGVTLAYVSAMAALRTGHYADAAALAGGIVDPTIPDQRRTTEVTRLVFAALADPGKKAAAMAARDRLYPKTVPAADRGPTSTDVTSCLQSSYAYGLLGELDTVFDLANQCLDAAAPGAINSVSYIGLWQPELSKVRQDPRFAALAARLGFMEYWRQYGPPDDCTLNDGKLACH
ncbi:MAG TPA: winged helix-turn-helix domain-containing protein [Steroidobacteraceae bacterium]|nr:winged helix-turn-helix domain-containing protein [Steroidobacteraceae bacterium]